MRITERRLRRIIRSVIKESESSGYVADTRGTQAQQIRDFQDHPNRNNIKKWKEEMIRQNWKNRGQC